jgi:hypothetical protein
MVVATHDRRPSCRAIPRWPSRHSPSNHQRTSWRHSMRGSQPASTTGTSSSTWIRRRRLSSSAACSPATSPCRATRRDPCAAQGAAGLPCGGRGGFPRPLRELHLRHGTLIERDDESVRSWAREPWACVIFNLHTEHSEAGLARAAEAFRRLIDMAVRRRGSYYLTTTAGPPGAGACKSSPPSGVPAGEGSP